MGDHGGTALGRGDSGQRHRRRLIGMAALAILVVVGAAATTGAFADRTLAAWGDRVWGASTFGVDPAYVPTGWARASAGAGTIERPDRGWLGTVTTFAGGEQTMAAPTRSSYTSPQTPTYGGWPGSVDFSLTSSQCVRHAAGAQCAPTQPDATSSAATTTSNLYLNYFGAALGDLLGVVNPVKVSVSCRPGQLLAPSPTGAVMFRHSAVFWESVAVPTQPGQTTKGEGLARQLSILWNVVQTATSIRSELIMTWTQPRVIATLTPEINLRDVVLARAECGTAGQPPPLSARSALSSRQAAQATCPAVAPAGDEEMAAPTTTTRQATTGTPTTTSSPPAADAVNDAPVDDSDCDRVDPTAAAADPSPSDTPTSIPSPDKSASTTTTSEAVEDSPARPPPEDSTDAALPAPPLPVPDEPTAVSPGEEFTVVGADGADLGTARIDEVLIDQSCNTSPAVTVAMRMTVTPSTHTGEYALDRMESSQFSQGHGSGAPISSWGQPCGSLRPSLSTLTPGQTAAGWVVFEVSDNVAPVLWQPNGTPGWLISLPVVSASPSEVPPTSPTSPSASLPSMSADPEQSDGSDKDTPGSTEPDE